MNGAVLAFEIEADWSEKSSENGSSSEVWESTDIFGPLTESFKDVSGGRMDVSSHCLLNSVLEFQLLGVDEGAGGYATEEVAASDDVATACRASSLRC